MFKKFLLIFIASILIVLYLLPYNLSTPFGLIDDHSITHYLGPDKKINLAEIPHLISKTEVGQFGKFERYRPSYFILQVFESYVWSDSPILWYGSRILMFAFAIAVCWFLVSNYIGVLASLLFVLYILTYSYWADIWARLGPAEIYGVFGTALYILGFSKVFEGKAKKWGGIVLLALGFFIAVGAKESFLILTVPTAYLLFNLFKGKEKNIFQVATIVLLLIFAGLVFFSVAAVTFSTGRDVYQGDVSSVKRATLFLPGIENFITRYKMGLISLLVVYLGILTYVKKRDIFSRYVKISKKYVISIVVLLVLFISQFIFYNGNYPVNIRYDFPGMLTGPFIALLTFLFISDTLKIYYKDFDTKHINNLVVIVFAVLIIINGFGHIRAMSKLNHDRAIYFSSRLERLTSYLEHNQNEVIVFDSYSTTDYEPIFSTQRYLNFYGVRLPMHLVLHGYTKNSGTDPLGRKLSTELYNYSVKGSNKEGFEFRSISRLDSNKCISVIFSTKKQFGYTCKKVFYL